MTDMDLKQARAIARSVGATIEESESEASTTGYSYRVRLGVCVIGDNGTREYPEYYTITTETAAATAVLETAKASRVMMDQAKKVYVDSDLIFAR